MDDLTMTKNRGRETRRAAQSSRSPAQWCWKCLRVPGLGDGTYGRPWPIWGFLSHGGSPVVTMVVHPFMVIPHVCFEFPKTPNADITSNWIPQSNISSGQCLCYRWWTLISQLFLFWCAVPWIPWRFRGPPSPLRLVVVDNAAVLHTVRTRYKRTDIYTFATTSGPQNGP